MKNNELVEEKFDFSQKEMNFILKSGIRFGILNLLHKSPLTIRDINSISNFSYSAIVSHLKRLEDHGLVEKDGAKYGLTEDFNDFFENLLNLNCSLRFIKENKSFLNNHKIFNLSSSSLSDISPLYDMDLISNDNDDIFKVSRLIEDLLMESNSIKSIFPYFSLEHENVFDYWINNGSNVDLILSKNVYQSLKNFICEYEFDGEPADFSLDVKIADPFVDVLLAISDKGVLLGFYNNDGDFDGNSIFFSRSKQAMEWANQVFKNYGASCGEYIGLSDLLMKNKAEDGD